MATHAAPVALYTDSITNFGFLAMGGLLRLLSDGGYTQGARALCWPLIAPLIALGLVPDPMADGLWLVVTPMLAALLVLAVAQAQTSRLVALLEVPALVYMGRISYGFYLFHNLYWLSTPLHGPSGVLASMGLNFAVSLALAIASWELLERPILERRWPWTPAAERLAAA